MRKNKGIGSERRLLHCALAVVLIMTMVLILDHFTLIVNAQSQGKVTVAAAKIRKEADAGSEAVGSAAQGAAITINSEVTGSDGNVWYQVNVDADTVGYIRSDLVEKTDGGGSTVTTPPAAPTAQVSPVQPQSATVTGAEDVRVRADASTSSSIVTTIKNGGAMTVTGQTVGSDGKTWYEVKYIDNGTEVTGFIRSDYVALSGELVPGDAQTPPEGEGAGEGDTPQVPEETPPQETKAFDTRQEGDAWYLLNNDAGKQYNITELLDAAEKNAQMLKDTLKTVNTQKIVIIVLVILAAGMSLGVTMLILKMKDIKDEAYFSAVETETIRGRNGSGGSKVMHSVGTDKTAQPKQAGPRPGGTKAVSQGGTRPAVQSGAQPRPAGQTSAQGSQGNPQSRGPAGQTGKPQGGTQARPGTAKPQGGQPQGGQQARPGTPKPQGGQQARPVGQKTQGAPPVRPSAAPGTVPGGQPPRSQQERPAEQKQGWKSKNFMTDDDEFEFEFLNWDGDDK